MILKENGCQNIMLKFKTKCLLFPKQLLASLCRHKAWVSRVVVWGGQEGLEGHLSQACTLHPFQHPETGLLQSQRQCLQRWGAHGFTQPLAAGK